LRRSFGVFVAPTQLLLAAFVSGENGLMAACKTKITGVGPAIRGATPYPRERKSFAEAEPQNAL